MTKCIFLLALLAGALAASADDTVVSDPNLERGVLPSKAYDFGEIDTINLYNLNLNLTVPLGQSYPVGGNFSYALALHYGGNSEETGWREIDEGYGGGGGELLVRTYTWQFPSRYDNAGYGWKLSLGNVIVPDGACVSCYSYESPDGALHPFYPFEPNATFYFTMDGTYLRMSKNADGTFKVEFPDGTIQTHISNYGWTNLYQSSLRKIEDRFGNSLTLTFDDGTTTAPAGTTHYWHLHDSAGRNHYAFFKPGPDYNEFDPTLPNGIVHHDVLSEVHLAAFNGNTLVYKMTYVGEADNSWSYTSQNCSISDDPTTPLQTGAARPAAIEAFDGNTGTKLLGYELGYPALQDQTVLCYSFLLSGNPTSVKLPTGGTIQWAYSNNANTPQNAGTLTTSRTVSDASGNTISKKTYASAIIGNGLPNHRLTTVTTSDAHQDVLQEEHHFTECTRQICTYGNWWENGLPLNRDVTDNGGRFLSTRVLVKENGNWVSKQETYLRYEEDPLGSGPSEYNRRVASMSTITFHGDGNSDYTTTDSSNWDGVGHYRYVTTDGNFGHADVTATFTDYNPGASLINVPTTWILNTYDYQTKASFTDASLIDPTPDPAKIVHRAMTQACYDDHGFLTRRRTLRADLSSSSNPSYPLVDTPPVGTNDFLAVFTRNSSGDVTNESYYGGDLANNAPSNTDLCSLSLSGLTPDYSVAHTYASGALATSGYTDAAGASLSYKTVDRTIDANTGLPSAQKEGASSQDSGLTTFYDFDALSRVIDIKRPQNGAWTKYAYTIPLVQGTTPQVDQYDNANGTLSQNPPMSHTWMQFDTLGHVTLEGRDMPGSQQTKRFTTYDALGRKQTQSEWSNTPALTTRWTYDALGRPTVIRLPNGDTTTFSYVGIASRTRSVSVATGGGAGAPTFSTSPTTENYDRQGRVISVLEPNNTLTTYTYDEGDRLSSVCMNVVNQACGQSRSFTYDRAGLLTSEQHPEKGTSQYKSYDAKGHLRWKYDGTQNGPFDVKFDYDRGERLLKVYEDRQVNGVTRTLKELFYGTDNDTVNQDYRNGKLTRAVRHNWFDSWRPPGASTTNVANIQVAEDYTYAGVNGGLSKRVTSEYDCIVTQNENCAASRTVGQTATRQFSQTFGYDARGLTTSYSYPSCLTGCGSLPSDPDTTLTYDHGLLTQVNAFGGNNSLTYGPDGILNSVTHANNVVDQITTEPGMGRPLLMKTSGAVDASTCTAPSITTQPAGGAIVSGQNQSKTLTAVVTADTNLTQHPLTLQWYQGLSGDTSSLISGATSSSLTVSPTTTTSYWLKATNNCGTATSLTATVTVCTPPSIGIQPRNVSGTIGSSGVLLSVSASGVNLTYQWYSGASGVMANPVAGATTASVVFTPSATSTYWVRVTNDCGSVNSTAATVTMYGAPTAPSNVTATYDAVHSKIHITWTAGTAPAGGLYYQVYRSNGGGYTGLGQASLTSYDDFTIFPNIAYAYRVLSFDKNSAYSPQYSNADGAVTMTFSDGTCISPTQGLHRICGDHVAQLRRAVDAFRDAAGLTAMWTAPYPALTGKVHASDILALRTGLADAFFVLHLPTPFYGEPNLDNQSKVKFNQIDELRVGVQ